MSQIPRRLSLVTAGAVLAARLAAQARQTAESSNRLLVRMDRREFLGRIVGVLAATDAIVPTSARAQQPGRIYRIGWLSYVPESGAQVEIDIGLTVLARAGFVRGKNLVVEMRAGEPLQERLEAHAAELARTQLDLIFVPTATAALVMRRHTSTIPIVAMSTGDPVAEGFAASFARPGGNVTGVSGLLTDTGLKRYELLKEIFPTTRRLRFLTQKVHERWVEPARIYAAKNGMLLVPFFVESAEELESFFANSLARDEAVYVGTTAWNFMHRATIVAHANRVRAPVIYPNITYVEAGGLVTYQSDPRDGVARMADLAVRVLRGEKPADIPFEQLMRVYLVINQKTAKSVGVTFPPSVLVRADRVIE